MVFAREACESGLARKLDKAAVGGGGQATLLQHHSLLQACKSVEQSGVGEDKVKWSRYLR